MSMRMGMRMKMNGVSAARGAASSRRFAVALAMASVFGAAAGPLSAVAAAPPATSAAPVTGSVDYSASLPALKAVDLQLIAATSDKAPTAVILKWMLDGQWLPDSGFSLYRKGPGESNFRLLAGAIRQKSEMVELKVTGVDGVARTLTTATLQATAKLNVKLSEGQARLFNQRTQEAVSSAEAFGELQKAVGGAKWSMPQSAMPEMTQYLQRLTTVKATAVSTRRAPAGVAKLTRSLGSTAGGLGGSARPSATAATAATAAKAPAFAAIAPTTEVQVAEARRKLTLGALLSLPVSEGLGTAFVDKDVVPGQTYEYQLKPNGTSPGGTVLPTATCKITVGADPLPAQPSGLMAMQRDAKSVVLRWTLDDRQSAAKVIGYDLYRIAAGGKRTKVNGPTIVVGPTRLSADLLLDPLWYFSDTTAPAGQYGYELVGVDSFGRQSLAASTSFTKADWETPTPPADAAATLGTGKVAVYWQASKGATLPVLYNVYRRDQEGYNKGVAKGKVSSAGGASAAVLMPTSADMFLRSLGGGPPTNGLGTDWVRLNAAPIAAGQAAYVKPVIFKRPAAPSAATKASSLTFLDSTAQPDHYYSYCVTAMYAKNSMESLSSPMREVTYPDNAPPAPPAGLKGDPKALYSASASATFSVDPLWAGSFNVVKAVAPKITAINSNLARAAAAALTTSSDTKASLSRNLKASFKATVASLPAATPANSDLGCTVKLTWSPSALTAPVKYRVYRALASGYVTAASSPSAAAATSAAKVVGNQKLALASLASFASAASAGSAAKPLLSAAGAVTAVRANQTTAASSLVAGGAALSMAVAVADIPWATKVPLGLVQDYTLLGEVGSTGYSDNLPRSRAVHYNYKVTAVNRWGIEGQAQVIQVRVPATMKPPTPDLSGAVPNELGGVTLTFKPLPAKEECVKYLVFRKRIDLSLIPRATTLMANTAALQGIGLVSKGFGAQPTTAAARASAAPAARVLASQSMAATKLGMTTLQTIGKLDKTFTDGLRGAMAKADYGPVAEVKADAVDSKGLITYRDISPTLEPNVWYSYTIAAVDADSWQSSATKPLLSTVWKVRCSSVSKLLVSEPKGKVGAVLGWRNPSDAVGCVVQRAPAEGGDFVQVSNYLRGVESYTDFGVMAGKTYRYRVLALDAFGNVSDPTEGAFAVPVPPPPISIGDRTPGTAEPVTATPTRLKVGPGAVTRK